MSLLKKSSYGWVFRLRRWSSNSQEVQRVECSLHNTRIRKKLVFRYSSSSVVIIISTEIILRFHPSDGIHAYIYIYYIAIIIYVYKSRTFTLNFPTYYPRYLVIWLFEKHFKNKTLYV